MAKEPFCLSGEEWGRFMSWRPRGSCATHAGSSSSASAHSCSSGRRLCGDGRQATGAAAKISVWSPRSLPRYSVNFAPSRSAVNSYSDSSATRAHPLLPSTQTAFLRNGRNRHSMLSRACTAAAILGERGATASWRPLYFGIDPGPMQVLAGSLRRRRVSRMRS